jgi:glycosyltransferase involved in cell wall biosynthesis|tara:strand:+ start:1600 stop:2292 length:693 start_codon:yes stop_codon:yes gene_type:complete
MKVSVLMPVYNTNVEYLSQTVDSILEQTFTDFEVVVVDNGSTNPETVEFLGKLKHEKFKVVSCPQKEGDYKNLSVALNFGLQHCEADLIARIDSDDRMTPDRLEKQVAFMDANPDVSVLGGQSVHISDGKTPKVLPEFIHEFSYFDDTHLVNHPSVMFRKQDVIDAGGYLEQPNHIPEDFLLWVTLLRQGRKMRNLSDVILEYRDQANGLSDDDSIHENWNKAIASVLYN